MPAHGQGCYTRSGFQQTSAASTGMLATQHHSYNALRVAILEELHRVVNHLGCKFDFRDSSPRPILRPVSHPASGAAPCHRVAIRLPVKAIAHKAVTFLGAARGKIEGCRRTTHQLLIERPAVVSSRADHTISRVDGSLPAKALCSNWKHSHPAKHRKKAVQIWPNFLQLPNWYNTLEQKSGQIWKQLTVS